MRLFPDGPSRARSRAEQPTTAHPPGRGTEDSTVDETATIGGVSPPPARSRSRPRPDPNVVGRRMGQEFVLIHLQTNRVYALNRTGARLWELLGEGCDREQIRERMAREFDVSDAALAEEIERLLAS